MEVNDILFRKKVESKGSITIFFSLILILILSFVLTIVEGARLYTAQAFTQRALITSMDSILAEYYGPLWDEYHIFGLDLGYGSSKKAIEEVPSRMEGYMSDYLSPSTSRIGDKTLGGMDLFQFSIEKLTLKNPVMLSDYKGDILIHQATEYMKYKELANGVEKILEKMSLLETPKKVSIVYEEKLKVEEELGIIDEGILKLMELLDGVKTSKRGIDTTMEGSIKSQTNFIKKFCMVEVNQYSVAINHSLVFQSLKENYLNPLVHINQMEQSIEEATKLTSYISNTNSNYYRNNALIKEKEEAVADLYNKIKELEQAGKIIKNLKDQIQKLQVEIKTIEDQVIKLKDENNQYSNQISAYKKQQTECKNDAINSKNKLTIEINSILPLFADAKETLALILNQKKKGTSLMKHLELTLEQEREGLDEEVYEVILEEVEEIKKYTTQEEQGFQFEKMKEVLVKNEELLKATVVSMEQMLSPLARDDFSSASRYISQGKDKLSSYTIDTLVLDYSTLTLTKESKKSFDSIKNLMKEGISTLIIDPDIISNKAISEGELPSQVYEIQKELEKQGFSLDIFLMNLIGSGNADDMLGIFQTMMQQEQMEIETSDIVTALGKKILYQEYLKEHCYSYMPKGKDTSDRKPSALDYELEYLLYGNLRDESNLQSMISNLIMTRILFNFISLLKDKVKSNEAYLMAAAIVGFTGLPILVNITKVMILLIWSMGEALIDTSALIQGFEVAIVKKEIILSLTDLFLLNRGYIEQKATKLSKESTSKELSLTYSEYLYLFLLSKNSNTLSYKTMDLIQENLRLRFEENFCISNCLYGFEVYGDFYMPTKFIGFLSNSTSKKGYSGYRIHNQATYSY